MGRGEFVRLLLEDAGIDFEYVRYNAAEWKEQKQKLLAQNIHNPTMPYITVNDKYYGKTVPIMRFLATKLNQYQGSNEDEVQLLDAYADVLSDWTSKWAFSVFGAFSEVAAKNFFEDTRPQLYKNFDAILSETQGPYLLGNTITYPDFLLYHILEDDKDAQVDADAYPYIATFAEAIKNRPNLKTYFATDRK